MRRGKPLKRTAPLVARTGLARGPVTLRRKPMARTAQPAQQPAQRPRTARPGIAIPQAVRDTVTARSGGVCEARILGVCQGRATNMHHRRRRNILPAHTVPNLMHLCGSGTTGCHGWITAEPAASKGLGWIVPPWHDPAVVSVLVCRRRVLLTADGRYTEAGAP